MAGEDEAVIDDELDELEGDGGEGTGSEGTGSAGGESAGNAWDKMPKLSDLLEKAEAKSTPTGDAEEAGGTEGSEGKREAAADDTAGTKPGEGKASDEGKTGDATARPFVIQDAEGNRLDFELEPGTTIAFKADGKDVTVSSFDELIGYASKGVHADRKLSTMGQDLSRARSESATLKTTSEELLLKALFDRDARQALRKALAPFRDPEVRKGHEALAREAERSQSEKTQTTEQIEQAREEFWSGVGRTMKSALPEFQYLTEEDAPEITKIFYANYEEAFNGEFAKAKTAGKSDDEAAAVAQTAAFHSLNDANLRKAMERVHTRYETRFGKAKPAGKGAPVAEADAKKVTEAHNRHTDTKLEQRNAPRLRARGAAPAATEVQPPTPTTYKGREGEIKGLFDKMRRD